MLDKLIFVLLIKHKGFFLLIFNDWDIIASRGILVTSDDFGYSVTLKKFLLDLSQLNRHNTGLIFVMVESRRVDGWRGLWVLGIKISNRNREGRTSFRRILNCKLLIEGRSRLRKVSSFILRQLVIGFIDWT